jgi:hypothetical protein
MQPERVMRYPRIAADGTLCSAEKLIEAAPQCEQVSHRRWPTICAEVHEVIRAGGDAPVLYKFMPQLTPFSEPNWSEEAWNLSTAIARHVRYDRSRWMLKRTDGQYLKIWGNPDNPDSGWAWCNCLSTCPKNEEGQTYLEWLAIFIQRWIVDHGWGTSPRGFDGILFEVFCLSFYPGFIEPHLRATIDRGDGTVVPWTEFLADWKEQSERFVTDLLSRLDGFPLLAAADPFGMDYADVHGCKFEDWGPFGGSRVAGQRGTWEEEFNGGRGRSLVEIHNRCRSGSRLTMLHLPEDPSQVNPAARAQQVRMLVGTASLLDCLALYSPNPWNEDMPEGIPDPPCIEDMAPYAAMDWGQPTGEFIRVPTPQGAIYTRQFELGLLVVNPTDKAIMGVPAGDVLFPSEVAYDRVTEFNQAWISAGPLKRARLMTAAAEALTDDQVRSILAQP